MDLAFPLHFDARGRTADAPYDEHIRQMIEQLLFTAPGERVNRPDFGSGILQLVFAPNSPELAAALQFTIQAALQQWLGDVIDVKRIEVDSEDSTLRVELDYVVLARGEQVSATFTSGATP
jgi:phage baseplate assembly protein W